LGKVFSLKVLRAKRELLQKDVAKILGITTTCYVNKENGKSQFTMKEILKLSEFFNVTTDVIIKGE